jgi:hypothetical protein
MTDLAFLLDAPTTPARRYPVARLGQFRDRRYGEFAIDPGLVASETVVGLTVHREFESLPRR